MVFACRHASLSLTRKRSGNEDEGRETEGKSRKWERQRGKGQSSKVKDQEEREGGREKTENHIGKTWWGGERGGRQSWNVRPGTSRTHPEKAQMAA